VTGADPAALDHLIAARLLNARPAVVWRALTTPEHLSSFWGGHHATVPVDSVTIDLRVAGGFALTTVGPHGSHRLRFTYLDIDEPRRLTFSEPETGIVTNIDLAPQGHQTFLTVHQRRVPPQLTGQTARRGLAGILEKLDELVAALAAGET
jgi:uncharacterized protein YndB with AHSA1/START domain